MTSDLGFIHRFVPATTPGRPSLLLLHGTGGDEHDFVPFGEAVAPGAALLSPRGPVIERGMPRFFGRIAEGVFDPAEIRRRAHALGDFVEAARAAYGLATPVALGFSNGANVAAALMLLRPGCLAGAALLRPMDVLGDAATGHHAAPVLMVSGAADPMVSPADLDGLAQRLAAGGAEVERQILPTGHNLGPRDGALVAAWLDRRFATHGNLR